MNNHCLLRLQGKRLHVWLLEITENDTPLHTVVWEQNVDLISTLINGGAEVNIQNKSGYTPLHIASHKGNVDIVEKLLFNGANVNAQCHHDETPLHLATDKGHVDIVDKLLFNGADVNVKGHLGTTPLHIASENKNADIAQKLVARGADIKLKNRYGLTALHLTVQWSCSQCDNSLVKMFLENGAEVNAKDFIGLTPLDYALSSCIDPSILDLIYWGAVYTDRSIWYSILSYTNIMILNAVGLELKYEHEGSFPSSLGRYDADILKKLLDDVERMKAKTFNQFSLCDVFRKWNDPLLLSTDDMEKFINSPILDLDFSWFARILRSLFVKNKRKLILLNLIQQRLEIYLPEEIVRIILSYK